jgi:large subunit ribosomal protein L24e
MPTCTFCRKSFKEPRGLTIFTFDGKSIHYCSSKCRRNAALGRDGRKMNWTKKNVATAIEEEAEAKVQTKQEKN